MSDRYFVARPIVGDRAVLVGSEAHHASHVMRVKPGGHLVLFDGSGAEFQARVERITRTQIELAVLSRHQVNRELPLELTLAATLPKGDRRKWLVEKAVELGVSQIVPLVTSRSVAPPSTQAVARLRRTVIEASKQCGRNRLTNIGPAQAWQEFVAASRNESCRILAHPVARIREQGETAPRPDTIEIPSTGKILVAVGPEGGFAPQEVALATAAGWRIVDLGPRTLRVETAALLMVALIAERLL